MLRRVLTYYSKESEWLEGEIDVGLELGTIQELLGVSSGDQLVEVTPLSQEQVVALGAYTSHKPNFELYDYFLEGFDQPEEPNELPGGQTPAVKA